MRASIVDSFMGVFGFGDDDKLVDKVLFPKDAREIADRLEKIETGKIVDELAVLLNRLSSEGYESFVFERDEVARNVREKLGLDVNVKKPSGAGELLRGDTNRYALEAGFVKDEAEVSRWMHMISMELTKLKVRKATEKRDLIVVQTIQAVDDLEKTLNLFMSRIREWYGLHFPELNRLVDNHETYARLVAGLGDRSSFKMENLTKEGLPKSRAAKIADAASKSMGAELLDVDLEKIQETCEHTLQLYEARASLEKYTEGLMEDVAPNLEALAGSNLGARLVALAGGLSNLAKMPASTIQVLGAEKALFRSLRTGARPPKHGVLFQHRFVHDAKRWQRGRIARALAGKLAIAARSDAFSGKYIGDALASDLQKRVEEIRKRKTKPTQKRARVKKPSKKKKRRKGAKRRGGKG